MRHAEGRRGESAHGEFARFLLDSLCALERESPQSYAALCEALDARCVAIRVDAGAIRLAFEHGHARVEDAAATPSDVELATDKSTILDLIDARVHLLDAIAADRFRARGALDSLARFDDALHEYLNGAVRCRSMPPLLDEYRRHESLHEGEP